MLEFYQKNSWRSVLRSWWLVGILFVVCVLLAFSVYDRYTIEKEMAARRIEAEKALEGLAERKNEVEEQVNYLKSERGIEAEMRRNFDVAQPDEQVVIILDPETEPSTIEPLPPSPPDTPPWYIFWR